jgi:hypothetical protein
MPFAGLGTGRAKNKIKEAQARGERRLSSKSNRVQVKEQEAKLDN